MAENLPYLPSFHTRVFDTLTFRFKSDLLYIQSNLSNYFQKVSLKSSIDLKRNFSYYLNEEFNTLDGKFKGNLACFPSWGLLRFETSRNRSQRDLNLNEIISSLSYSFPYFNDVHLTRVDIAYDVPEIVNLSSVTLRIPYLKRVQFAGESVEFFNKQVKLKIYDKRRESKLDHDRFRFELTFRGQKLKSYDLLESSLEDIEKYLFRRFDSYLSRLYYEKLNHDMNNYKLIISEMYSFLDSNEKSYIKNLILQLYKKKRTKTLKALLEYLELLGG